MPPNRNQTLSAEPVEKGKGVERVLDVGRGGGGSGGGGGWEFGKKSDERTAPKGAH